MKTRTWRNGTWNFKGYYKTAGNGYEVTLYWGKTQIFVGNFIHATEATQWWTTLNKEVRTFNTRYPSYKGQHAAFFKKFLTNQLYKAYYTFLDKKFTQYNRTYTTAWTQNVRRYSKWRKGFTNTHKTAFRSTAA